MEDFAFEAWILDVFLKYVENKPKPIVIFFDGHNSHITYKTMIACSQKNVHIICLPPNTSSALQPLDVAVYGPVKLAWKEILSTFFRETNCSSVRKTNFFPLLNQLWKQCFVNKPQYIINGFKKTGLFPLNKDAVPKSKLMPSSIFVPTITSSPHNASDSSTFSQLQCDGTMSFLPQTSHSERPSSSTQPPFPSSPIRPTSTLASSSTSSAPECPDTPRTRMEKAIIRCAFPAMSESTKKALKVTQRKRTRMQKKFGEVMTQESAMKRLKAEEKERATKRKNKTKNAIRRQSNPKKQLFDPNKCFACKDEFPPEDTGYDSEEEVDWIECERCHRWYHMDCIEDPRKGFCTVCF